LSVLSFLFLFAGTNTALCFNDNDLQNIRKTGQCPRCDLAGAYLTGSSMPQANLAGVDLSNSSMSSANLVGANLTGANLYGINMTNTKLNGANLVKADLRSAILTGPCCRMPTSLMPIWWGSSMGREPYRCKNYRGELLKG